MKILLVIDVQNDFIDGALANEAAQNAMPRIREKVNQCRDEGYKIIFTRDTHGNNYLDTLEGKYLPYPHCIKYTHGWKIAEKLVKENDLIIDKPNFGYVHMLEHIYRSMETYELEDIEEIELIGFCTDICVISTALILKAELGKTIVSCDATCCAGTSEEAHKAALMVMKCCQVEVRGDY